MYFIATSSFGDWSRSRRTTNEEMDTPDEVDVALGHARPLSAPRGSGRGPGQADLAAPRGHSAGSPAPSPGGFFRNVRWSMAKRKWIFRRDPKPDGEDGEDGGGATQEYELPPEDGEAGGT